MRPLGNARVQGGRRGGVGVYVGGDVDPGGARGVELGQDARHGAVALLSGTLEVPYLHRNVGRLRDLERLVDRLVYPHAFVPQVCGVETAVPARCPGQRDELVGRGIVGRGVDERRRDSECTLHHRRIHQCHHAVELFGSWVAVLASQHHHPHLRGANERRQVDGRAGCFEPVEVAVKIVPVDRDSQGCVVLGVVGDGGVGLRRHRRALARDLGRDALVDLARGAAVGQRLELGPP